MTASPGIARIGSITARPADKGAERRVISAVVEMSAVTGRALRRSEARQIVRRHIADGSTPDEIEAYLRFTYRLDPVGVSASRNVDRERLNQHG